LLPLTANQHRRTKYQDQNEGGEQRLKGASQDATRYTREQGIRKIAEVRGRSYGFVYNLLNEPGVELRGRGGDTHSKIKKATRKKAGV
jgi:hypothetical protein